MQFDLFESAPVPASASASPIVGMKVQLPHACACGSFIGVIGSSGGPHANRVTCDSCNGFRRWLGHREANFIARIASTFGRPTTPIVIRDHLAWGNSHDAN
jgi:hypothetical protein